MKTFNVKIQQDVTYSEISIVSIEAESAEEAKAVVENGDYYDEYLVQQDVIGIDNLKILDVDED